ncbi:MAG: Smr/MutS family protein [Pseudomonadota bacterium]
MTRRKKGLSAEDKALWHRVTAETIPLRPTKGDAPSQPTPKPPRPNRPLAQPGPAQLNPAQILKPTGSPLKSSTRINLADHTPKQVGRPEPGLDRRTAERLRRGERAPEDRIDLHGMTAERAHGALNGFIARAISRGLRCVLVITGKGGRHRSEDAPFMRADQGVLRQAVPRWLKSGPYAHGIVGIFEAHIRHGGSGALYVYLKKRR